MISRRDEPVAWQRPIAFMVLALPLVTGYAWALARIGADIYWAGVGPMMSGFLGVYCFAGSRDRGTVPRHRAAAVITSAVVFAVGFVVGHLAIADRGHGGQFLISSVAAAAAVYGFAAVTHLRPSRSIEVGTQQPVNRP